MEEVAEQDNPGDEDEVEIELRMGRFESLMDRRPLLLNSVLLRQNPHNVPEWQKRVDLLEGKPRDIVNTYTEAVQTIDPKLAVGKLASLWTNFAKFYETNKQLEDARIIFEKGTHVAYLKVEDLASLWCEWVEMELRHNKWQEGLKLLQRATAPPPRKVSYHDQGETVQMRLHKSLKVWSLYADLEESFGTFKSTKAVYDRIVDLKIATPQIIINYGLFLKENNYFEEAFKAYEKGISLFKWPNVYDIWNTYLSEFLARYGGAKLERTRDLFEQCLDGCPEKFAKNIFLLYAKLEEEHGMARHAMAVYDRAIMAVEKKEQAEVYNIYLRKAAEIYGVTRTRQIYEKAIETLGETDSRTMCTRFAEMETKLGEIDRARAIYSHASQMCDPRVTQDFWQIWKEFEVKHGNEDTLREMLRIKRSVQAVYNTQVNMMASAMMSESGGLGTVADLAPSLTMGLKDDMWRLEARGAESDVKGGGSQQSNIMFVRGETQSKAVEEMVTADNPDEIDISEDEDDEEGTEEKEEEEVQIANIEEMDVPDKVFGGLKKDSDE
jgi:pre-mRNA-splicing factor SYF1